MEDWPVLAGFQGDDMIVLDPRPARIPFPFLRHYEALIIKPPRASIIVGDVP